MTGGTSLKHCGSRLRLASNPANLTGCVCATVHCINRIEQVPPILQTIKPPIDLRLEYDGWK